MTNVKTVLFIISLCLFACVYITAQGVTPYVKTNLLAALPKAVGSRLVTADKIENINEIIILTDDSGGKIMLTYQSVYEAQAKAAQASKPVKLTAVNFTYPYVMGYAITYGSFFSKQSQESGDSTEVLNKKAAFDLFGSVNLAGGMVTVNNKPYIVTGVIDDGSDNLNIFVPALSLDETGADGCLVSLNGTSEEQAKNELKQAGVDESRFYFINLGLIAEVVTDKVYLSGALVAMGALLLIIKKAMYLLKAFLTDLETLSREKYLRGILTDKSGTVFKLAAAALFSIGITVLWFTLLVYTTEKILVITAAAGTFDGIVFSCFTDEITGLRGLYQLSNTFFIAFAAVFDGFTVMCVGEKRG